jgi:hypothetical protein
MFNDIDGEFLLLNADSISIAVRTYNKGLSIILQRDEICGEFVGLNITTESLLNIDDLQAMELMCGSSPVE